MATREISNFDNIIDSRDVIERIAELSEELDDLNERVAEIETEEAAAQDDGDDLDDGDVLDARDELIEWQRWYGDELAALEKLAEQAEGYASDWKYGETLIRDSYFQDYAEQLADDIGAIDPKLEGRWPYTCIDWERAARELQQDYTAVDFAGVTYWVR